MSAKIIRLRLPTSTAESEPESEPESERLELTDEALVAACATEDTAALGALYRRHHLSVFRFLSRLLGARTPELEDLVQQVFLGAWGSAARYRRDASVRSWLFGIAANLAGKHQRSQVRRRTALHDISTRGPPASVRPDEAASQKQLVERLAIALERLPQDLRVAYVMCELEDVPGVEAAKTLGVRPGTMWRRLHQARRMLREMIETEDLR